jgi:hypothetical protein
MKDKHANDILHPVQMYSHTEILDQNTLIPAAEGIFAWYFKQIPENLKSLNLHTHNNLTLAYIDSSPQKPLKDSLSARGNIRKRMIADITGSASTSSIRRSLGCLLREELNLNSVRLSPRIVNFGEGERDLSGWISENVKFCWLVNETPTEIRDNLISEVQVPLTLSNGKVNDFFDELTKIRSANWN